MAEEYFNNFSLPLLRFCHLAFCQLYGGLQVEVDLIAEHPRQLCSLNLLMALLSCSSFVLIRFRATCASAALLGFVKSFLTQFAFGGFGLYVGFGCNANLPLDVFMLAVN